MRKNQIKIKKINEKGRTRGDTARKKTINTKKQKGTKETRRGNKEATQRYDKHKSNTLVYIN